jgi:cytochrome c-type biogenesis protein CcmF
MLAEIGSILIGLSLFSTFYADFVLVFGQRKKDGRWIKSGQRALYSSAALLLLALLLLLFAFITNQFQFIYVAENSSLALPFTLKMSAVWAGQEGSLLLWAFLQALFTALVARKIDGDEKALTTWATVILGVISAFFIGMTLIFSNPFLTTSAVVADGLGMNPLLRHPAMIFHPPALYVGYVGLAVPFAFALAGLICGDSNLWIERSRHWLLMSWLFLGIGIFLGARWAYDVLGWGGYWGWDAVENAGLMPWLTATGLLHGLDMQSRGKGFKVWNVSLAVLSYALVVFGTFATRSGLIQSVHAFSQSTVGFYFLAALIMVLLGSLVVIIVKRKAFEHLIYPEKFLSREGATFFTLLLLVLITLSILTGTLLPTLTDGAFSASPEWFNRVVGPQLGLLVFIIGICPLFGRVVKSAKHSIWQIVPAMVGTLLALGLAWWGGFRLPAAMIGLGVSGFAGGTALSEIGFNIAGRIRKSSIRDAFKHLPFTGKHGYGGHLVHLGIVLMAIGVIGTQIYESEDQMTMLPGDTAEVGSYTLIYEDLFQETAEDHLDTWASIAVYQDSEYMTTLDPQMTYYLDEGQTMAEPAIRANLGEDLYLVLFQWDETGQISISAMINPLSGFLWLGGILLFFGGVLAWWPRLQGRTDAESKRLRVRTQIAAVLGVIIFILLLYTLWGPTLSLGSDSGRPLPGEDAPAFSATDVGGEVFNLAEYRGQIVVINFWATWCPQCEDELPAFESVWREHEGEGVQFVGVAMDDTEAAVIQAASEMDITFPLLVEEESDITSLYGITAVPETFIIDSAGNIAYFHIGTVDAEVLQNELAALLEME